MISKKELLQEMGISYGQLYRWKREGLIPDAWFVKQAVPTGQETFFKRDQIISRITKIIELKDIYPLDKLIKFLNPDINERSFSLKEAVQIAEINPLILKMYAGKQQELTIYDLIVVYLFSKFQDMLNYQDYQDVDFSSLNSIQNTFYLIKTTTSYFLLIAQSGAIVDPKLKIAEKLSFEEISALIAQNLR